jgi:hypothetical protein
MNIYLANVWEDWHELIGRVLIRIGKRELCLRVGFLSLNLGESDDGLR